MAKFSKPVAFNPEKNEKDRLMVKHVKHRNFSGYVKKLIWKDMNLEKTEKEHLKQIEQLNLANVEIKGEKKVTSVQKPTASERIQQLKAQTKKQQTSPSPLPFMPSSPRKY